MAGSWVAHQVNSRAFASTSCTDGSNVSPSATQSEVQRNPPGLLLKLREMGAIPHLLRSNRTGESVLLIAAGKLCSLFLRRAYEQSGFQQLGQANAMRSQTAVVGVGHSLPSPVKPSALFNDVPILRSPKPFTLSFQDVVNDSVSVSSRHRDGDQIAIFAQGAHQGPRVFLSVHLSSPRHGEEFGRRYSHRAPQRL